ncbi:MAG TPA: hypothetical protein VG778_00020, partial [Blastocatellia bacterium]|nr:hypothetical protein [Blastocatellia bacterium]
TEMSFDKMVKGAPYSATAVTENIQTLADGNRIVHKNSSAVYRDSEGRTRREHVFAKIGPYAPAGDAPHSIFINDPVAAVNYVLEPANKTARKMAMPEIIELRVGAELKKKIELADQQSQNFEIEIREAGKPGIRVHADGHAREGWSKPVVESLGKQMMEGVEAEGTRTTITIPAGQIGNEQPINMVNERWYSPELQVVVMSRRSDPRAGETIYRLTGISRAEPSRSLFEVPADYTVVDKKVGGEVRELRKKLIEQQHKELQHKQQQ